MPIEKNRPLVHWSASALSTAGVLTGHGPSSNVSTTSLSARKSSCLKCSKPKPGPPVVSISTTRLTPSASGLAQPVFCELAAGAACIEPVISTGASGAAAGVAAATWAGSAFAALAVLGEGTSGRGEKAQNHTPAITTAATTLASIRPNALRILLFPPMLTTGTRDRRAGPLMQRKS